MEYRVDELASRAGISVDTVRFYQTKGLLPPPQRSGRIALYSPEHLERLRRIKDLKARGLSLAVIRRVVSGNFDRADEALVGAVSAPLPEDGEERFLTRDELAGSAGVSPVLLEAIERDGLLVAHPQQGEACYTEADVSALRAGLTLLEAGLPLSELLALGRDHDAKMRATARHAVDLFLRFVRDPIRASAENDDDAARRLVEAFERMLPAVTALVAHHFRRVLLAAAMERIEREGVQSEIRAVRAESARRIDNWTA